MDRKIPYLVFCVSVLAACGGDPSGDVIDDADQPADANVPPVADYTTFGPYTVGHVHFVLEDVARARTLPAEAWYPATESVRGQFDGGKPITAMFTDDENALLAPQLVSPSPCLTTTVHAVKDAEPAPGPWPLVVFSHCSTCMRTSNVSIVERLVSHGFAVVAVDSMLNGASQTPLLAGLDAARTNNACSGA